MSPQAPPSQGSVHRPGATILQLFVWAVLTGIAGGFLVRVALHPPPGFEARGLVWGMAAFALLFGPAAFFAYFVRYCLVWVCIDPRGGLLFSSGRAISWHEIKSVELRERAFKGLIRANPLVLVATAGCAAFAYFIILPSVALFTPWHRRVLVTLQTGELVMLRDLSAAESFVEAVAREMKAAAA